ncbi:hypothetical protein DFQ09_102124 [Winogradskyella pacifica]|uniref:Uncharacterized protein n=1 Tax=Winogradskyella pacifica TaxID=664642 RepID=A0A3D9N3K0_9FLAO|nr:hypothetical protein DFQ09_102124 [Winogradskyella pacifica]
MFNNYINSMTKIIDSIEEIIGIYKRYPKPKNNPFGVIS